MKIENNETDKNFKSQPKLGPEETITHEKRGTLILKNIRFVNY
jgi:hypothetical protein